MDEKRQALVLKNLEDLSETDRTSDTTARLLDYDWFLLYWIQQASADKPKQAAILSPIVRPELYAMFQQNLPLIRELQRIERERASASTRIKSPKKRPKK